LTTESIKVGRRVVEISNADKLLFPDDGITELDLAQYYRRAASAMLPHVKGRPVSMRRFPGGVKRKGFIQKEIPGHFPSWVRRVTVERERGGKVTHVVCDNPETLVYLADQACITPDVWLSRAPKLKHPDRMIFDLDPADGDFRPVRDAARILREVLEEIGLVPYVMTTGGRGLHVTVPLTREDDFDAVRAFSRDVAELVAAREPERLTTEQRKAKRRGRLFLDVMRNSYGQHAVAPYAVRAAAGAPVATPLEWQELGDSRLHAQRYTIRDVPDRLRRKGDSWKGISRRGRSLSGPLRRLEALRSE
jgi:bifunctional non-homologous end joining protein LigD